MNPETELQVAVALWHHVHGFACATTELGGITLYAPTSLSEPYRHSIYRVRDGYLPHGGMMIMADRIWDMDILNTSPTPQRFMFTTKHAKITRRDGDMERLQTDLTVLRLFLD